MPLVKPLAKRRARCEAEDLGDTRFPVVPQTERLRAACARAWGRPPDCTLLGAWPSGHNDLERADVLATTVLEGGWTIAWSGTLLSRGISVALNRPTDPVEIRRPPTRYDCGAAAWMLTRLLTDWLGDGAPGVRSFEPGWCPPSPLPPWRLELRWRFWERGRAALFCPSLPDPAASNSVLSSAQRRRMEALPVRLRPQLERIELSPGGLETLRPGDLLALSKLSWRDRGLSGPIVLEAGPIRRRAWLEHAAAPAAPTLRVGEPLRPEADS